MPKDGSRYGMLLKLAALFVIITLGAACFLFLFPNETIQENSIAQKYELSSSTSWTSDTTITDGPLGSGSPSMAISDDGTRHIVWSDTRNGPPEIYYRCLDTEDKPLGEEIRITRTLFSSLYPNIYVGPDSTIHITWLEMSAASWDIYYTALEKDSDGKVELVHVVQIIDLEEGVLPLIGNGLAISDLAASSDRFTPFIWGEEDGSVSIFASASVGKTFQLMHFKIEEGKSDSVLIAPWSRGDSFILSACAVGAETHVVWLEKGDLAEIWYSVFDDSRRFLINSVSLETLPLTMSAKASIAADGQGRAFASWFSYNTWGNLRPSLLKGALFENSTAIEEGLLTERYSYPSEIVSSGTTEGVYVIWSEEEPGLHRSMLRYAFFPWTIDASPGKHLVRNTGSSRNPYIAEYEELPVVVWEDTRDARRNIYIKHMVEHESYVDFVEPEIHEATTPSFMPAVAGIGLLSILLYISRHKELLLLIPAYSRLSEDDILSNPTRKMIMQYVEDLPGSNFTRLMDSLQLQNGVLSHHLKTLERAGFIRSKKDGSLRRYYPSGCTAPMSLDERILFTLASNPGISQSNLAEKLGVTRQVINYHMKLLLEKRKVTMRREGKSTCCYALSLNPD